MEDRSSIVGYVFPPYQYVVERIKIREFAESIGETKDMYFDIKRAEQAGYVDIPAPPTFAAAIDAWAGPSFTNWTETLKVNPLKVLHGGHEFEYQGDIIAGDTLTCTVTVADYIEKPGMHLITLLKVYVNQNNQEVLKCRMNLLELK